ncbi:MAG: hypothetical protein LC798_11060 [Chloroflexi bacterium]|nr:hypothetical protein [Chloroflexota bacterium]
MTDNVLVNAERTAVVDQFSPGKKWQMSRKEAKRLGLLKDEAPQARRTASTSEDSSETQTTTAPRKTTQRRRSTKR